MSITFRAARASDVGTLTRIYDHFIASSNATLDEQPFSEHERQAWFERFADVGPHRLVVAVDGERVLGCASSSKYREHFAYRETVETGIFLDPEVHGRGIGHGLYLALFRALEQERLHRAVAAIALPNDASVRLHSRVGFRQVGTLHEVALRGTQRLSVLWLEKALSEPGRARP